MMKRILPFLLSTLLMMATGLMATPELPLDEGNKLSIEANVYPNPTSGQFHLSVSGEIGESYELKIINLIGTRPSGSSFFWSRAICWCGAR
ncbi:MAG: hypothetical protein AAF399_23600 [Bacteroidota bacterium]